MTQMCPGREEYLKYGATLDLLKQVIEEENAPEAAVIGLQRFLDKPGVAELLLKLPVPGSRKVRKNG